jgi:uncharacterized protein YegJ (DUF2314 family)
MKLQKTIPLILFSLIFTALAYADSSEQDKDVVYRVESSNNVMNKAIHNAQATLDAFLRQYEANKPNISSYKLKVKISDENGTEHFWIIPFKQKKDGTFEGTLANKPQAVKTVKEGQLISFTKDMISDWGYTKDGIQYGSFTVCALLKTMPKDEAAYYKNNHGFLCTKDQLSIKE